MLIVGVVFKNANATGGASQDVISNAGLGALPNALIAISCILLVLFVANCFALCSGDGKCKLLKKILGVFYCILGLVVLITGAVMGGNLKGFLETPVQNNQSFCNDYQNTLMKAWV